MIEFVKYIFRWSPLKSLAIILLTLVTGFLEGTGILLLIPLLSLSGIKIDGGAGSEVSALTARLATFLGTPSLGYVLCLYIALVFGFAFLSYIKSQLSNQIRFGLERHLRVSAYQSLLQSNYRYLSSQKHADITQALGEEISLLSYGTLLIQQAAVSITMVGVYIAASAFISGKSVLIFILLIGIGAIIAGRSRKNPIEIGNRLRAAMNEFYESLSQYVAGIKAIKIARLEETYSAQFEATCDKIVMNELEFTAAQSRIKFVYESVVVVSISIGIYLSVVQFKAPVDCLILSLVICARLVPRVIDIHQKQQQIANLLPRFFSVRKLLDGAVAASEKLGLEGDPSARDVSLLRDKLTVRDLSFSYGDSTRKFALSGVSLEIPVGTFTGIKGSSGSGKTTLGDLLSGMLTPTSGTILVDGVPLTESNRASWRANVCYVPQDPFLFSGTIRENLSWGHEAVSDEALWDALDRAQLGSFVRTLPKGLSNEITNNGSELSGGQRQRLVLARIFLRTPALLILDEVTSQLDAENQAKLAAILSQLKGKVTTIIISHNEVFLAGMDRVVVLEDGGILCLNESIIQRSA